MSKIAYISVRDIREADFAQNNRIQYSTVKYIFLSDKSRNKAILTGYGRDRSQESFQRVPKKSIISKIHNYHFFTTFLPLWISVYKSCSEYPRRF